MQDSFDPYQQWLGIPPSQQPPNHYCLLGIAPFESDLRVIALAIDQRTAYVRVKAGAEHPEALEDVLEDLTSAKHLLLNPTFKQQYDAMLRGQGLGAVAMPRPATPAPLPSPGLPPGMATPPAATPAPVVAPAAVHVATPSAAHPPIPQTAMVPMIDTGPDGGTAARTRPAGAGAANGATNGNQAAGQAKSGGMSPVLIGGIIGGLLAMAVVAVLLATSGSDDSTARAGNSSHTLVPVPQKDKEPRPKPRPQRQSKPSSQPSWRNGTPPPMGSRTMADLMEQADNSPPDTRSTTGLLTAARMALADRQIDAARHHVEAAGRSAKTPTEKAEVDRVEKLLAALEKFWEGVRQQAERLQAGEELEVGSTIAIVVENEKNQLILRVSGTNRIYQIVDNLPRALAVALAERQIGKNNSTANLRIGVFLAVDAQGDREQARTRLEAAGPEGKALLPELALAGSVKPPNSGQAVAKVNPGPLPGAGPGPAVGPVPPKEKLPVPNAVALAAAETQLREVLRDEFAGARNRDGKVALAKKLYSVGEETNDNPAARYFAYSKACDIAVELGDPESFCWAIDRLDQHFKIDALGMKAARVATAWREQTEATSRRQVYQTAKYLLDEAMRAKHAEAADNLIGVATAGAKAEKDWALVRKLEEQAKQVDKGFR